MYGSAPSQGACSVTGSSLTCALGDIDNGAGATVTLTVAGADSGPLLNSATVSNVEGNSADGSATTQLSSPSPTQSNTTNTVTVTVTRTVLASGSATLAPYAVTGRADRLKLTSSDISGEVTTGGLATRYFFEYGTSRQYGNATPVVPRARTLRSAPT